MNSYLALLDLLNKLNVRYDYSFNSTNRIETIHIPSLNISIELIGNVLYVINRWNTRRIELPFKIGFTEHEIYMMNERNEIHIYG